jgi:3-phenylpropionate/trans-cinnamate dioxygenase ferredoxin reductase component
MLVPFRRSRSKTEVHERAVIVGASLGGLRTAEQLRARGWDGPITVIGAERHMPYNRPPLSKELLRDPEQFHESVALPLRQALRDVTWRLGVKATAVSLNDRQVKLSDGTELGYRALVIATGIRPRRLPGAVGWGSRHVIRTLDDAVRLRSALRPNTRIVVVGAGFIGCEVAATAQMLGCRVTVVEPAPTLMAHAMAPELASAIQGHHEQAGIRFLLGRLVKELRSGAGGDQLESVVLDDGTALAADVVVESIGSIPNTEWLHDNNLDLSNGVLCDNNLQVDRRPEVVAVGDIACFPNPLFDNVPRRVEHWSMPTDTAKRAATSLLGGLDAPTSEFRPVPSFWSDQLALRIQGFGSGAASDRWELIEGDLGNLEALHQGIAFGGFAGERLVAVVTVGLSPARAAQYRKRITSGAPVPTGVAYE